MILKEYSKLILNESSKLILRESSKLILNEAENINPQDETQTVNKVFNQIKEIGKKIKELGQSFIDLYDVAKDVQAFITNIDHTKDTLDQAETAQERIKIFKDYYQTLTSFLAKFETQFQKLPDTRVPLIVKFKSIINNSNFKQLKIEVSHTLSVLTVWVTMPSNEVGKTSFIKNWEFLYKSLSNINHLYENSGLNTFIAFVKEMKQGNKAYQELTIKAEKLVEVVTQYAQIPKKYFTSNVEENVKELYESCKTLFNKIKDQLDTWLTWMQESDDLNDFKQLRVEATQLSTEIDKITAEMQKLINYFKENATVKTWDEAFKKASLEGSSKIKEVLDNYYKVEWGKDAELLESITDAFFAELRTYGYTAETNPFIVYLQAIFKNEEIRNAFKTTKAINYDLLHNAVVNDIIKINELKGGGTVKENNIIFSPYFYSIDTATCQQYLNLHDYVRQLTYGEKIQFRDNALHLTRRYSENKINYYIDLFYQNGKTTIPWSDKKLRQEGNIKNPFKPVEQIKEELKEAFTAKAVKDVEENTKEKEEKKNNEAAAIKVDINNYQDIIKKLKRVNKVEKIKLLAIALLRKTKKANKTEIAKNYNLNLNSMDDDQADAFIKAIKNYNFTEVLDWGNDMVNNFIKSLVTGGEAKK